MGYKTRKTWLPENIKKAIKIKNNLYKRYHKFKNDELWCIYIRFRNKLNGLMAKAEKDHFSKLMEEHKNNLKKSWSILKDVINKKKSSVQYSRFLVNNQITNDKKSISNGFNSFFVNVGPSLASKIPSDNRSPSEFMKNRISDDIIMKSDLECRVEHQDKSCCEC